MKLKTTVVEKEVIMMTKVIVTEKYSDVLIRTRKEIAKILCIEASDCKRIPHINCGSCPLGDSSAPMYHQCIATHIDDILTEAIEKCQRNDI
jgi:hypothetical protein